MNHGLIDITLEISENTPVWEGDPPASIQTAVSREQGAPYHLSRVSLSTHTGTHIDAPFHFLSNGRKVKDIPLESFFLPVRVVTYDGDDPIPAVFVEKLHLSEVRGILFKTKNSQFLQNGNPFRREYVSLGEKAADVLIEQGIQLVGIDYLSIEAFASPDHKVHKKLLAADVVILEGVQLAEVEPGEYELICLPLKIGAPDGAPVRAILRKGAGSGN